MAAPAQPVIVTIYIRSVVPEASIKGRDKYLHSTVYVGCNYLSLPPASGTTLLIYGAFVC